MMQLAGRLLAPEDRGFAVVTVEGDRVSAVEPSSLAPGGCIGGPDDRILPGLIDIQVNGAYGQDFSDPTSDIELVRSRLPEFGVAAFAPTIISSEPGRYGPALENLRRPEAPGVSRILGVHVEGPFLSRKHAGTHNRACLRDPDIEEALAWLESGNVAIVTLAPELPHAGELIRCLAERGVVVSMGHSHATWAEAAAGAEEGASLGTHLFNAMPPIHHRNPGLAGFLMASSLPVSVIADGVHVDLDVLRLVARVKAPAEFVLITDALAGLGMPIGRYELAGTEFISDGVVGRLPDGTLSGSLLPLNRAIRNLVNCGVAPSVAVAAASENPARVLRLNGSAGRVEVGGRADLVVVDRAWEVVATVIGGVLAYERQAQVV
jgi:N-acetylglucosamine-6-phosphate deacetylase